MPMRKILGGGLARNAFLALLWQVVRVGAQGLWLVVLARKLGAEGYGTFAGAAGLAVFMGAFSGLGLGLVLLKKVSKDRHSFSAYWHKALKWTLASGGALVLLFLLIETTLFDPKTPFTALLAIGVSEALLFPLVTLCAFAFNAHERLGYAAAMPAFVATVRFAGATAFLFSPVIGTLTAYALVHVTATVFSAGAAIVLTLKVLRPAPVKGVVSKADLGDGIGFSAVWAATNALSSLDKTLVLHLAGGTVAGIYASAYRLTMIFALPIDALAMSSLPRIFRHGEDRHASKRLTQKLVGVSLAYSVIASVILYLSAGIIPVLLGTSFMPAVASAQLLAWLLPAYAFRMLAGNILIGLDKKRLRLLIETAGIVMLYAFAYLFVPHYGLAGAGHMIIATEASLALISWAYIGRYFITTPSRASGANQT